MNAKDISAVDQWTAWAAIKTYADLYRTVDGGDIWNEDAPNVSGPGDIDDICVPDAEMVWAAQNQGATSGAIIRVGLVNGAVVKDIMNPVHGYEFEGVTCLDEKTVWVVGRKPHAFEPNLPDGVIVHTTDGSHWKSQSLPVKDVALWKVSFVGARR